MSKKEADPAATPDPEAAASAVEAAVDGAEVTAEMAAEMEGWRESARAGKAIDFELVSPVRYGQETVESLKVRPLNIAAMKKFPLDRKQLTVEHYMVAAAKMCGRSPLFMDELSAEDGSRLMVVVELFLAEFPEDWREALGVIALRTHFQPEGVDKFSAVDLRWWLKTLELGAREIRLATPPAR